MESVSNFRRKRNTNPISINGTLYIPAEEFASRVGISVSTVYQWNYDGTIDFGIRYLGRLYYEDKAIEPFKRTLMERIKVSR
jgi:predicted site-specific integrase-resolvase